MPCGENMGNWETTCRFEKEGLPKDADSHIFRHAMLVG